MLRLQSVILILLCNSLSSVVYFKYILLSETAREQTDKTLVAATKYSTIGKERVINPKSLDTPIAAGILSSDKCNNTYQNQKFILVGGTGRAILYMYVCVFFLAERNHDNIPLTRGRSNSPSPYLPQDPVALGLPHFRYP